MSSVEFEARGNVGTEEPGSGTSIVSSQVALYLVALIDSFVLGFFGERVLTPRV